MELYNFRHVYLIRHGATALNSESGGADRIRGWKNIPLSPHGKEEVEKLAHDLKDSGIDIIVSSDLDRAKDTAEAVAKTTGARVELSKKLRPWDLGEYTGQESMAVHPVIVKLAIEKPWRAVPGGESFDGFCARVFNGLREIMLDEPTKKMALVTHHRDERLIKAWIALGSPASGAVDHDVMFRHGEKTAHAEQVKIDLSTLYGLVESK